MIQQLVNNVAKSFTLSIILLTVIVSIFFNTDFFNYQFLISLTIIAFLISITFGVIYPFLWKYGTFSSAINITLSTSANVFAGFACMWLFSKEMFFFIASYWFPIALITLIIHIIIFYFYAKYDNERLSKELNAMMNNTVKE